MTAAVTHAEAPRLALVLGSGGVKSVAALGVAQVLEEAGLRPQYIAGSSAGAMFGALLACGHDASASIRLATMLWSREVTSRRRRGAWMDAALATMSRRRRERFAETFALRDDTLIRERLWRAFGDRQIEDLPITLNVNATDAVTGEPVLLTQGSLLDALRATIALPFLFAPHRVDGRLLVDGSVCDPLPVQAAAHARVTLAVGFPVPLPRQAGSVTRLATRVTASLTNNLLQARVAAHDPQRLLTLLPTPDRRVGLFDTEAIPAMLELGRHAARAALPRLRDMLAAVDRAAPETQVASVP